MLKKAAAIQKKCVLHSREKEVIIRLEMIGMTIMPKYKLPSLKGREGLNAHKEVKSYAIHSGIFNEDLP